ncbi:MAG: hypothetical protein V4683_12550 [Bacteroidota bacterium]
MNLKISISSLKVISVIYLAFPYFIFFLGWLKLPIGVFLSLLLLVGLYLYSKGQNDPKIPQIPLFQLIAIFLIVLLWVLFSGAGGFGYQNHDYYKHNSLLKDLTDQHWPVSYIVDSGKKFLSHYLAYYLPGPGLFASLGWKYVNMANFFLTLTGVLIAVFWLLRFVGKFSFWVLFVFILAGGAHLLILYFTHGGSLAHFLKDTIQNHGNMFWLNCLNINGQPINKINFMTVSDMLYWGPQHAISCWIGMGLLLNDWLDKNIKYSPFYISLIAFWAPLALIGIAPFLLYFLVLEKFKGIFNWVNMLIAPIIFIVIGIFLTSIKTNELIHHFLIHDRSVDGISILNQIVAYFYFLCVEVFIWWIPAFLILRKTPLKKYNGLYWLVLALLMVIPLFRYGQWNDWCTRVSLPALYVLYAMMAMAIINVKQLKIRLLLITVCLICALSPITLIMSSLNSSGFKVQWTPPVYEFIGDLPSASVGFPVDQFVADPDCFFYKYLAKTKSN